jgi:hypothetical protein
MEFAIWAPNFDVFLSTNLGPLAQNHKLSDIYFLLVLLKGHSLFFPFQMWLLVYDVV